MLIIEGLGEGEWYLVGGLLIFYELNCIGECLVVLYYDYVEGFEMFFGDF